MECMLILKSLNQSKPKGEEVIPKKVLIGSICGDIDVVNEEHIDTVS